MKNLSIVLNVVLLVAVAVLYVLHFSSKEEELKREATSEGGYKVENSTIVYINSDSVVANYEYLKDKQVELESKTKKLDNEYKNRAQGLQTEFNNYQQNASNLTIGQARAVEEDLMKKQQNLKLYEQSLMQELANDEALISNELYERVSEVVNKYGVENNIHLVMKYSQNSDVIYANEGMDITDKVIEMLNSDYANNKDKADTDSTAVK